MSKEKTRQAIQKLKATIAKTPEYFAEKSVALRMQGFSWPAIFQKLNVPDYQGEEKENFIKLIEQEKKKQGCILQ